MAVSDLILVVDADAKSRGVLELSLRKAGHHVESVAEGRGALGWLEDADSLPGLIISSAELPGMSGFELCKRVKENLDWEPIPFVFLIDANSTDTRRRGLELGVEDFLTRPIYVKEITTRVQLLLQRRAKELLAMADADGVEGALEDGTLIDLLQAIEEHGRTGVAELTRGAHRGVLYFREGRVIDAAMGKLRGAAAVHGMMLWGEGAYVVRYTETVMRRERIESSTQDLLLDGMRAVERWESAQGSGPALDRLFEVNYRLLADHLREMPDEVNKVIRLFDGYRTVHDVIDDSSLGAVETLQIISKLQGQNLIYDVTPEQGDENLVDIGGAPRLSDWLGSEAGETVEARPARKDTSETEAAKNGPLGAG